MIEIVSAYQKTPDAIKTNFYVTKNKPTRIIKETVKDKVQLSTEGIQKARSACKHVQIAKELFESKTSIDPQQQENIEKLISNLKAIQKKSEVTEEQIEILKNDLKSTLQGVQKPSKAAVENLVVDFSEITSDGRIDLNEIKTLQGDINLVLNSANISDEKIQVLKEDFQAIGESSNISEEDLKTLWNDTIRVVETASKSSNL